MTFRSVIIKGFAGVFCLAGLAPSDFYRAMSKPIERSAEASGARSIGDESRVRSIPPSYLLYIGFLRFRHAFDTVSPLSIDAKNYRKLLSAARYS